MEYFCFTHIIIIIIYINSERKWKLIKDNLYILGQSFVCFENSLIIRNGKSIVLLKLFVIIIIFYLYFIIVLDLVNECLWTTSKHFNSRNYLLKNSIVSISKALNTIILIKIYYLKVLKRVYKSLFVKSKK